MSEFNQSGWGSEPAAAAPPPPPPLPPPPVAPGWGPLGTPVTPRQPSRFAPHRPELLAALKAGAIAVLASVAFAIATGYLIIFTATQDLNSADKAGRRCCVDEAEHMLSMARVLGRSEAERELLVRDADPIVQWHVGGQFVLSAS